MDNAPAQSGARKFAHRTLSGAGPVIGLLLLVGFVWYSIGLLLIVFTAALLAIFLRSISRMAEKKMRLPHSLALAAALVLLLGAFILTVRLLYPEIVRQTNQLREQIPVSLRAMEKQISGHGWGASILSGIQEMERQAPWKEFLYARSLGAFNTTLGAIAAMILIFVLGFYFAAERNELLGGFTTLIPTSARARCREVLSELGDSLELWIITRIIAMAAVGILTWLGLFLLHIPLALTLGLLAGLLNFVPNFGPVISIVPAILLALIQNPIKVLYVIVLYVAVHFLENYALAPVLVRETLEIPISLLLIGQLLLGELFGGIGVIVAAPLTVAAYVLVKKLYVEKMEERNHVQENPCPD